MNFLENSKENEADRVRSYSRFFHSRVMAVVSGVDRSTLFRGRFIVHSRSEAHAHRPIEIRLACRSRVRADRAHARTHWDRSIRARRCTRPATAHTTSAGMQMRAEFCTTVLRS